MGSASFEIDFRAACSRHYTLGASRSKALLAGFRYAEVATNLARQILIDFAVARDARGSIVGWIVEDGVSATFPPEAASVDFEVAKQVALFHRWRIESLGLPLVKQNHQKPVSNPVEKA